MWSPVLWLALKLLSVSEGQKIPKASLLLVVPLLQILSSTALEDCLTMGEEGPSRQQLALNLLEMLQRECYGDNHHMVMNSSLFLFRVHGLFMSLLMQCLFRCGLALSTFVRQWRGRCCPSRDSERRIGAPVDMSFRNAVRSLPFWYSISLDTTSPD